MLLKQIKLKQFRNFENASFQFNPSLTIIVGENAKGKTNILESIYFLLSGYGFRESREEELITFGDNELTVEGMFTSGDYQQSFQIFLKRKDEKTERIFLVHKTKKRLFQYQSETTKAVLFSPEQINIITDSPDARRAYMDRIISFYEPEHKKRLFNFENALRKRNKLLEVHKDKEALREELVFWNGYLEEQATYITTQRKKYTGFLNAHPKIDSKEFSIEYIANELTKEKLEKFFDREALYRRTFIGPQKDDFFIYLKGNGFKKNLHHYGSRSEQRLGIFWLKINEILFHEEMYKKKPILLLDDIFSELDLKNKKLILHLIKNYQTVLTTMDEESLDLTGVEKEIIRL